MAPTRRGVVGWRDARRRRNRSSFSETTRRRHALKGGQVSTGASEPTASVSWDVADGVATIELSRPDSSNALDLAMATSLGDAVAAVSTDDAVRCLLLAGRGRSFCAGGDLAAMSRAADRPAYVYELARAAHRAVLAIAELEVPVVAAVHGATAGAGLALTLVADIVIAGESAKFLAAYTQAGLTPDCGTSWLLPQMVGLRRALSLTLTDRRLSAREAADWGLITSVCPDAEVAESARHVALQMAAGSFPALGKTRQMLRGATAHSLAEQLHVEATTIAETSTSAAADARLSAFLNGERR